MSSVAVLAKPPFSLKTLVKDSNCVLIQDPSAIWGGADHLPRRNLLLATDTLATQNVTVTAESHTLYIQGTGSVTLSGTGSGTLQGTGANDRVSLVFTPTAGTLTLTVSGTVTFGMLCKSLVLDRSYQKITDWTTEQYAWAAQMKLPWLRRNAASYTETLSNSTIWNKLQSGTGVAPVATDNYADGPITGSRASRLQFDLGATPATAISRVYANFATAFSANARRTKSVYLKTNDGSTKTLYISAPNTTETTFDVTGDWQRFAWTDTSDTSTSYCQFQFGLNGAKPTSSTLDLLVYGPQIDIGIAATPYQRIATTWPAEYTTLALAAGYPISLYSDRAGTTATYGPDDPVGVIADLHGVAGPNQINNGGFDTDSLWQTSNGATISSGAGRLGSTSGAELRGDSGTVVTAALGKSYLLEFDVVSKSSGTLYVYLGNTVITTTFVGKNRVVAIPTGVANYLAFVGVGAGHNYVIDNVSLREYSGNDATAPGDAQKPVLKLDGNGKWYLDRDTTDDDLPITWPANLTTTGVQYVADQSTTTETTGITLNGATSYTTPQRPTGDYGRVIFKAPTPSAAKVKKYLDKKAGR
jgi:hypothetical protein